MRALLGLCVLSFLAGCGEKITLPEAQGIPIDSAYIEQRAWDFTDPVDVLEASGRIYVLEQAPGTLTRYSTTRTVLATAEGLLSPQSLALDNEERRVLVAEGETSAEFGVSFFDLADLTPLGRATLDGLVMSMAGMVTDGAWVYVSDPDSGVVHRFELTDEASGWLAPRGVVATDAGSIESPQFVFQPAGLGLDIEGRLLVCDADSSRNWVLRFDPLPPIDDPNGPGTAVVFREIACPTPPVQSFVLGFAPGCGETFVPGASSVEGGFDAPWGIAFDEDGRIYVTDRGNGRMQRFGIDGNFDLAFGVALEGIDGLEEPLRVSTWQGITNRNGVPIVIPGARVYVVDRARNQIRIFEDRRWTDFEGDA